MTTIKMRKKQGFFYLATLCLMGCSSSNDTIDSYLGFDMPKGTLDAYLEASMREYRINGLSAAVINDGEVVYHTVKGLANAEAQLPVNEKTIFEGASISKSVFGFFIMTFVEEGMLDLDKPLYQYMEYPDIAHDESYKQITARMVLSHRSGFPNWREDEPDKKLKIKFEPGSQYGYSGEGYQYLAKVLMHLLNTKDAGLEQEFQKRVAAPLGLTNTVFIQNAYTRKHKAEPYDENGDWIDWHADYWFQKEDGRFYAPSSIHSEPIDFSKWMIAIMNGALLSEESYDELLSPQSEVPNDVVKASYTLGFFKPHIPLTNFYLHSGNNEGFTSWFVLDTQKDWGFVLFTNSEYGEQLGQELFFYAITGPDKWKPYLAVAIITIALMTILWFLIRKMVRYIKRKRNDGH